MEEIEKIRSLLNDIEDVSFRDGSSYVSCGVISDSIRIDIETQLDYLENELTLTSTT